MMDVDPYIEVAAWCALQTAHCVCVGCLLQACALGHLTVVIALACCMFLAPHMYRSDIYRIIVPSC